MPKKFYKSKTFWISVLEIAGGFALYVAGHIEAGTVLTGAGLIQLFLRYVTKEELVFR